MPTYVYKNIETGERYEIKQSMRDDALTTHPETGAAIKRVLSQPGIAFRGSGFYVTDSRAGAGQGPAGESGSAGSKPGGSGVSGEGGASKGKGGGGE